MRKDRSRPRGNRDRPVLRERYAHYRRTRPERERVIQPRVAVPSFFTVMNLFCGFLAIVETSQSDWRGACGFILLAGLFDLLDGFMARLTRGTSEFGIQLDSLSDMVSFGIVTSFLLYSYGLHKFGMQGVIVSSLPAICGSVRLARFNLQADGEKHGFFEGLPIPAQAIAVVSLVLASIKYPEWFDRYLWDRPQVLIPVLIGLSVLMVTNIQFDSLPSFNRHAMRRRLGSVVFFLFAAILAITLQELGLVLAVSLYIIFSLLRSLIRFGIAVWQASPEGEFVDEL